jgi:hypothetical protein
VNTILGALKPAWRNPYGLKLRSVGEKGLNLFVAEFGSPLDRDRALEGSPWMVGKHAVILQTYDEHLKPTDICFDRMEMWVRILNLPLGWMNAYRGTRAMSLVGDVVKLDVDREGKASGPFLRGRVAIEIAKPPRRGVLLKTDKNKPPEWFDIQFEKLPYYCFSCGLIGHSELECSSPNPRNAMGKLPYDVRLRAPEEGRKRLQSFAQAAVESFGSGAPSNFRHSRGSGGKDGERRASEPSESVDRTRGKEVQTHIEQMKAHHGKALLSTEVNSSQQRPSLVNVEDHKQMMRKRKSKGSLSAGNTKPGSHLPEANSSVALVPAGLVDVRVCRANGSQVISDDSSDGLIKKQKIHSPQNARSAAAASVSPRWAQ